MLTYSVFFYWNSSLIHVTASLSRVLNKLLFTNRYFYCGVTRSNRDRIWWGYQKNKERVHELEVLWEKERLHSTTNKYIETLTFTRLQACCSQKVTLKILNSSHRFCVDHHFLYHFYFHHELDSFRGYKFLPPISYVTGTSELCPLVKIWGW